MADDDQTAEPGVQKGGGDAAGDQEPPVPSEAPSEPDASGEPDASSEPDASPYPAVKPKEQRLAGWGCIALLLLAAGLFWFILRLGRQQMVELDQAAVLDGGVYLSPAELDAALQAREARRREVPSPRWQQSYDDALDEAALNDAPLMLFFEAEASEASQRMHRSTFANSDVRSVLREFVALRVDTASAEGAALAARFEVEAPAVVYLDPEGRPLRPPSRGVVDADALEVFLREALGNLEDGRSTARRREEDEPEAQSATAQDTAAQDTDHGGR